MWRLQAYLYKPITKYLVLEIYKDNYFQENKVEPDRLLKNIWKLACPLHTSFLYIKKPPASVNLPGAFHWLKEIIILQLQQELLAMPF